MKTFLGIILVVLAVVGALAYKLCIPAMLVLIACKIWYAPYSWSWGATILVPLISGVVGLISCLMAKYWIDII